MRQVKRGTEQTCAHSNWQDNQSNSYNWTQLLIHRSFNHAGCRNYITTYQLRGFNGGSQEICSGISPYWHRNTQKTPPFPPPKKNWEIYPHNSGREVQVFLLHFYCCTVHFDICRVHSQTNVLFYFKKHIKIYIKIHIYVAPTCFGLQPSSGSLYWTWLKLYLY